MITGWGSTTDWSKWQNVEDENILCKDSDQSYIVQAITRWNNDADDNRQFRWVCSPPDNSKKDSLSLSASQWQNLDSLAMTGISTFSDVITGNCRYHSDWSNSAEGDGEQKCNKEEAMVGIKKTYFDSAGDDDWKYKIRCCKVCSHFCTFLVSRGHQKSKNILNKYGKILIIFCFNYCSWIPTH